MAKNKTTCFFTDYELEAKCHACKEKREYFVQRKKAEDFYYQFPENINDVSKIGTYLVRCTFEIEKEETIQKNFILNFWVLGVSVNTIMRKFHVFCILIEILQLFRALYLSLIYLMISRHEHDKVCQPIILEWSGNLATLNF